MEKIDFTSPNEFGEPVPNNFEGSFNPQKYLEYQKGQDDLDKVMEKIKEIIEKSSDKRLGEKEALEKYGNELDGALKKLNEAFIEWMKSINNED